MHRSFAEDHLMPASLKRIPSWFQNGPFRYNLRFLIGLFPGILLLLTVTGKRMMAFVSIGGIAVMLIRGMDIPNLSMFLSLAHIVVLECVNVYSMVPLIVQSILNIPLFVVLHYFIAVCGLWWCLQDEEFKKQDPRYIILGERVLFWLAPLASMVTVSWLGGMLFGRYSLPIIVCLTGVASISLFMVPLQSSLSKPQTPTDVGLVQNTAVVWGYLGLQLLLSPLLYAVLSYDGSLQSLLLLLILTSLSPFLLTLLEAQGLFYWTPLSPRVVQVLRLITGTIVLALLSLLILTAHNSTYMPLLLVPTLFIQLGLMSTVSSEHTHKTTPTIVLGVLLGALYSIAFFLLPWSVTHAFSFLSLPLAFVQLVLWSLALASVAIATLWSRSAMQLLLAYNTVFVFCEYLLTWDQVYPLTVSMVTTATAAVMFWRLYSIRRLPSNHTLLGMSLHLTKLSLLFPSEQYGTTAMSLVSAVAVFIIAYSLLRGLLVHEGSTVGQLMVSSGLLSVGLVLAADTVLTPLWAAVTLREPTGASLVATVLVGVGLFILVGLSLVTDKAPSLFTVLPHGLFVMATLVAVLQPEFNLGELMESLTVAMGDGSTVSGDLYLAAWANLLTWVTLYTALFACLLLLYMNPLTVAALTFLGLLAGFLAAITLVHYPPGSLLGALYGGVCAVGGALLGRAWVASETSRTIFDHLLFLVQLVVSATLYVTESSSLPRHHLPSQPVLDYYALPSTRLVMLLSLATAVTFRVKMYFRSGTPYVPVVANISCLLFFLLALLHPLHKLLEVSVLLTSCVFLLAQPDGKLLPQSSALFLAPSLVLSVTVLYFIAAVNVVPELLYMVEHQEKLGIILRVGELLLLIATVPGQGLFMHHLWFSEHLKISMIATILFIVPSALLPQLGSNNASSALGGIGVMSFCLLALETSRNSI